MISYLIGMMASGKTTIGIELARTLDYLFIDTDQLIEVHKQKKVHEIINEEGIEKFRELEKTLFLQINIPNNTIVACGGGIILNEENIKHMKEIGKVIYLKASIATLIKRLKETTISERPLLTDTWDTDLVKINEERHKLYEAAADFTINVDNLTVCEVTSRIEEIIKA